MPLPDGHKVMLKLTIPSEADLYKPLIEHPASPASSRFQAATRGTTPASASRANHGMIASFSRALVEELKQQMSDAEFNAALGRAIEEIYKASTTKH